MMSQVNRDRLLARIIVRLMVNSSRIVPNLLKGVGRVARICLKTTMIMTKTLAYIATITMLLGI